MKITITLFLLLNSLCSIAQIDFDHSEIQKADKNYWLGIDFYFNRLIDARQLEKDSIILKKFGPAWITVFDEFENESRIQKRLDVDGFIYKPDITAYRYKELTQFVDFIKRRVGEEEVYNYIKNLELPFDSGNAFIILPINMVKAEERTEMWLVCFRISDRKILGAAKELGRVNGHGMKSYWGESIVNGWRRIIKKKYRK